MIIGIENVALTIDPASIPEESRVRFWDKIDRSAGPDKCWSWTACCTVGGYGRVRICKRDYCSHRIAYTISRGPIPHGLFIRHLCDNSSCCNPDHLIPGSRSENEADKIERKRHSRGEKHRSALAHLDRKGENSPKAKFTNKHILEIRAMHALGNITLKKLADIYRVGTSSIHRVVRGKSWTHVLT